MRIAVAGDSFSEDKGPDSWTTRLHVTNFSQRGISQYRLYQQVCQIPQKQFDVVLVVHTSPYRIYCNHNQLHTNPPYNYCDLIYSDVSAHDSQFAKNVAWYFENVFDLDQANFYHRLTVNAIKQQLWIPSLHFTFFDGTVDGVTSLHHIWQQYPGSINHLSPEGNALVLDWVSSMLAKMQG